MAITMPKTAVMGDQLLLQPSGGNWKITKVLSGNARIRGFHGPKHFVVDVPPSKKIGDYVEVKHNGQDFRIRVPKTYQSGDQLLCGIKDDGTWGTLKVLGGKMRVGIKGRQSFERQPFVVDIP